VHADKEPEPLNLGVPVVNFPRANAILARAQALLWVRNWGLIEATKEPQKAFWHRKFYPQNPDCVLYSNSKRPAGKDRSGCRNKQ
jgi:hypothetical protein